MPKMTVTAKDLYFAGRTLKQGDEFEASQKDAYILQNVLRKAQEVVASPTAPAAAAVKAEAAAEPTPAVAALEDANQDKQAKPVEPMSTQESPLFEGQTTETRRRYNRRDVRATE